MNVSKSQKLQPFLEKSIFEDLIITKTESVFRTDIRKYVKVCYSPPPQYSVSSAPVSVGLGA